MNENYINEVYRSNNRLIVKEYTKEEYEELENRKEITRNKYKELEDKVDKIDSSFVKEQLEKKI